MKLQRITPLLKSATRFGPRNAPNLSLYSTSTSTTPTLTAKPWTPSLNELYRRISPVGSPRDTIVPILDQWIAEGRTVSRVPLVSIIKELRRYRRYTHALEVSMWMTDKRYFYLTYGDVAIRLDLIAKVHGIEQAENYFNNIPVKFRVLEVYSTLLNCYAFVRDVDKAEAVMQKMRDLGLDRTKVAYNSLLNLYYQTGHHEKLDTLLHEMEEKGIEFDKFTFGILVSAYAAACDVEGIHKILGRMESNPVGVLDWTTYAVAANGYTKIGLAEKALEMLKKSERWLTGKRSTAFNFLLTQYAAIGRKDEVLRLWELYKKEEKKIYNKGYMSIISSLLKFDDIDGAEEIFDEWESRDLCFDIRIPNYLLVAFVKEGLVEKAETLVKRIIMKGGKPNARTYHSLATGYLQINQLEKSVEAMNKAILVCGPRWKPRKETLVACLEYLKTGRDVEAAVEFIRLLRDKNIVSLDVFDRLVNYFNDSESSLPALDELGLEASSGRGETIGIMELEEDNGNDGSSSSDISNTSSENY